MIARRTLILFTAASLGLAATGAQASDELLGDILRGVADALTRDIIRTGAECLGWELDELFAKTIEAMRSCEDAVNAEMDA